MGMASAPRTSSLRSSRSLSDLSRIVFCVSGNQANQAENRIALQHGCAVALERLPSLARRRDASLKGPAARETPPKVYPKQNANLTAK